MPVLHEPYHEIAERHAETCDCQYVACFFVSVITGVSNLLPKQKINSAHYTNDDGNDTPSPKMSSILISSNFVQM